MGWLITLGILILLAVLPLGVSVKYNAEGPLVRLILGPVRLTVIPAKKKKDSEKKKKPEKKKEEPVKQIGKEKPEPQDKPKEEKGGSLLDFLPLVKTVFSFLGDFRRKLRVKKLELKLIMAGGDPYNLALNYGRAWAAVGNLLPKLEQWFVIQDRDVEVECDFTASETLVIARLDITITLGRLLAAVVRFAFRAIVEFINIKKKRKGGAKQ